MPVIAMTREMGSKGKDVAIGLAEQIGIHIVHHNLVEHSLSERLQAPESDVHRHLEGKTSLLDRWKLPDRNLSNMTACEVLELAEQGNVIIRGWGSTHLLRSVGHVLCVRVCAPLANACVRRLLHCPAYLRSWTTFSWCGNESVEKR